MSRLNAAVTNKDVRAVSELLKEEFSGQHGGDMNLAVAGYYLQDLARTKVYRSGAALVYKDILDVLDG